MPAHSTTAAAPHPVEAGRKEEVPVLLNGQARAFRKERVPAVLERVRAACKAGGLAAKIDLVRPEGMEKALRAALASGARTVVVGGGDGTVRTAAQVLAGTEASLGILALGTLNHCARDLGIPADLEASARIVAEGHVHPIDVGDLDGEVFVNNSSLGLYPYMVRARQRQERLFKIGRFWALMRACWTAFWRYPVLELDVRRPAGLGRIVSPVVFVGNGEYSLGPHVGTRKSLDDGVLFLCMLESMGRWRMLWLAVRSLFVAVPKEKQMHCVFVEEVSIGLSKGSAWVSLDGEVRKARGRLLYGIRPKALRVIVPRPKEPKAS
jgi:diacylglycerol kinase family enzyme